MTSNLAFGLIIKRRFNLKIKNMRIKVGEKVRYIGHDERYRNGRYKIVYENGASVAVENEDLLILGFDREVFLQVFTL
jgi:hypothetical protein